METWLSQTVLPRAAETAAKSHAILSIVNPTQFLPSRRLIRQRIAEGKLGQTGLIRSHRWEPRTKIVADDSLPTPLLRDLDVVLSIAVAAPNSVYARQCSRTDQRLLTVHLGFADGAMALVDYTDRLPDGDPYQALSVIGSQGAAYADDQLNQQLMFQGGHPQAVVADEDARQRAAIVQQFADEIQSGDDGTGSIHNWRRVLAVADSIAHSLAAGQAVTREDT
jgi:predicted dehydrogenase